MALKGSQLSIILLLCVGVAVEIGGDDAMYTEPCFYVLLPSPSLILMYASS